MNWKAYDEVHFSDQYIMRWVREGDEYVNRISKEMMEDLHTVVRQQQAEIEALKDFAIWMTGCGYDFCQHEYFIKCRDELLIGKAQEK